MGMAVARHTLGRRESGPGAACLPRRLVLAVAAFFFALLGSLPAVLPPAGVRPAAAQDSFLGVPVTSHKATYQVVDSVNVRAKPTIKSERVGGLNKGEKVRVVGRIGKDWLAVKKEGVELGFVYAPALREVIAKKVEADFSIPLTPVEGSYLVNRDVNVRKIPKTSGKRVARLKKGALVQAVGRPKDAAWLGVEQDGRKLGYVFAPVLIPLIDGTIGEELKGSMKLSAGRSSCAYTIRFDEEVPVEGENFHIYNYDLDYRCDYRGVKVDFLAYMFMIEASYDLSSKPSYQINVDLLEIGERFDEPLSAVFIYDRKNNRVSFEAVNQSEFAKTPADKDRAAADLGQALAAAAAMAPEAWNTKVWKALAAARP